MSTEPVKILVDIDVLETLLGGFGIDDPYDPDNLVYDSTPDLRERIEEARKAK